MELGQTSSSPYMLPHVLPLCAPLCAALCAPLYAPLHAPLHAPLCAPLCVPLHAPPMCCTVPLSIFADPERILRRLYVFAEEPCKSTTTTSEPCSPVFKEAQPRPSESITLEHSI